MIWSSRLSHGRYLLLLGLPLLVSGCHDETDGVLGIIYAVFDLVVNIVRLAS